MNNTLKEIEKLEIDPGMKRLLIAMYKQGNRGKLKNIDLNKDTKENEHN